MSMDFLEEHTGDERHDSFESITPNEQLRGTLVLLLLLLLAIVLRSL